MSVVASRPGHSGGSFDVGNLRDRHLAPHPETFVGDVSEPQQQLEGVSSNIGHDDAPPCVTDLLHGMPHLRSGAMIGPWNRWSCACTV